MESLLDRSGANVRGVKEPIRDDRHAMGRGVVGAASSDTSHLLRSSYQDEHEYYGRNAVRSPEYIDPYHNNYGGGGAGGGDPYSYSPQAEGGADYDSQPYYSHHTDSRRDTYGAQEYHGGHSAHKQAAPMRQSQPPVIHNGAPAPTLAGQANQRGGIYDRLSNPNTFTGVILQCLSLEL